MSPTMPSATTEHAESAELSYLNAIEDAASRAALENLYLWPRTPMGNDHQHKIIERVGASDYEIRDGRSRPAKICREVRRLKDESRLDHSFSVIDIACGDAIVLTQIKKAFPDARCYGVDCHKGHFGTHAAAQDTGVRLFQGYLQHVFLRTPPFMFDLALMLNTYRGWRAAELRPSEAWVPDAADDWFAGNARFTIGTATKPQILRLQERGLHVQTMGRGEDKSRMISFSMLAHNASVVRQLLRRVSYMFGQLQARAASK